MPLRIRSGYMDSAHDIEELADRAARVFDLDGVKYNTLVGIGLSGAIVVPSLARALGKHYLIARKPGDRSHSTHTCEGTLGSRWVFVDDFISSGTTLRTARRQVRIAARRGHFRTTFVGAYLYVDETFRPASALTHYQPAM